MKRWNWENFICNKWKLDQDYIQLLSTDEALWLYRFNMEYVGGWIPKSSALHSTPALKRKVARAVYANRNDILSNPKFTDCGNMDDRLSSTAESEGRVCARDLVATKSKLHAVLRALRG
jgi:hypothetical protein